MSVNKSTPQHTRAPVPSLLAGGSDASSCVRGGVSSSLSGVLEGSFEDEPQIVHCFVFHPWIPPVGGVGVSCVSLPDDLECSFAEPEILHCFVFNPLVSPDVRVVSLPPACAVGGRAAGGVCHPVFDGGPAGSPSLRLDGPQGDGREVAQSPPRSAFCPIGACEWLQAGQTSQGAAGRHLPVYGAGLWDVGSVTVGRSTPPLPWRAACVDFAARGPASVAGVLYPHALFDLGAGPSCVHPDVLPEHVVLSPFEGGLFGAGGQPLPCLGEAGLEVEACGRRCQHRFKVVPHLATPVLLGRDVIWGRLRLLPVPVEPGPTTTVTALVHTTPEPQFLGYVGSPPFPPEPERVLHIAPESLGCVGSQPFPPEPEREIESCVVSASPPLSLSLCLSLRGWVVWVLPPLRGGLFPPPMQE